MDRPLTFLCISNEFKGTDFLTSCKEAGNVVLLVTSKENEHMAWPFESIDEIFYMDTDEDGNWNLDHLTLGTAYILKSKTIDRVVALDDFDVEKAAHLREVFRIPGMGQTTHRYFRDKLAMRIRAKEAGISVPPFSPLFNDAEINKFAEEVDAPWVVKPRGKASASGITKVNSKEELWNVLNELGESRFEYLIEKFAPGDVFHVDALSYEGEMIFCNTSEYVDTPLEVAQGGGIFRSRSLEPGCGDDIKLKALTTKVLNEFGMVFSASHTEFIKSESGEFYFLETSSRVGGAHLAEMVEAATGINLWKEWAKMETCVAKKSPYKLPPVERYHAGIVVSLSRFETPDYSVFMDEEIWWRLHKEYHIGMIVRSESRSRVSELLELYAQKIGQEVHAVLPAK